MTTRKEQKLRPYRVDYFDIEEMKDSDLALVRSVIARAVTSEDAVYEILQKPEFDSEYPSLVLIRAYRYYKNLVHKKDVYKAVEDLFTANKAVEIMGMVEAYRAMRNKANEAYGTPDGKPCPTCGKGVDSDGDGNCAVCTSPVYQAQQAAAPVADPAVSSPSEHVTRFSDSSLYDEVCTKCGATDASGKLEQPCPAATVAVPPVPTSGPDSPATVAVVADLNGMISHDAHEQAMDTFVPNAVPDGKRFPDPENVPITALVPDSTVTPLIPDPPAVASQPTPETIIQTFEDYLHEHQELGTERITVGTRTLTWDDIAVEMKQKTALGAACLEALSKDDSFNRAPTSWTYGMGAPCATSSVITKPIKLSESEPLIEPDQAVGAEARSTYKPQFFSVGDAYCVAGVIIVGMAVLLYFILRSH